MLEIQSQTNSGEKWGIQLRAKSLTTAWLKQFDGFSIIWAYSDQIGYFSLITLYLKQFPSSKQAQFMEAHDLWKEGDSQTTSEQFNLM